MAKMDRLAVSAGLEVRQMMELAGFAILDLLERLKVSRSGLIVIVVGKGNKGGDGLSAARHLLNNGYRVAVVLTAKKIKPDAAHLLKLLQNRGAVGGRLNRLRILFYPDRATQVLALLKKADLVIDALVGYRLRGRPREPLAGLILEINRLRKKVIAYDIPTGINATTGACRDICLKAFATLTLALPKRAFLNAGARSKTGRLFLADIGIPDRLYRRAASGARRPDFKRRQIIEL